MRSKAAFVLIVMALSAVPLRAQGTTGVEKEVLQAQALRFKAMMAHDIKTLESMFADELTYCHASGAVDTRATYPDFLRTRRYLDISTEGVKVNVYGDAAVVTGRLRMTVLNEGQKEPRELNLRSIEVYVKRNARWQFAHFQATFVTEEQPTISQR
jgi:ketosteroid isomerase-like protein